MRGWTDVTEATMDPLTDLMRCRGCGNKIKVTVNEDAESVRCPWCGRRARDGKEEQGR